MSRAVSSNAMDALSSIADLAAIAAVVWMVVLENILSLPTDVEDVLNAAAYLVLGGWILLQAARTPTRTRNVRDGWMGRTLVIGFRSFKGAHAEFVARFRRGLTGWGWTWLILGTIFTGIAVMIIIVPGARREPELVYPLSTWTGLFLWLAVLTLGVVFLRCRRILDASGYSSGPSSMSASKHV